MAERFLRDNLLAGIVLGICSVSLDYILLLNISNLLNQFEWTNGLLKVPRIQIIILAVNIILFRFLVVKWNRYMTGSGLLIVIFAASLWYIYNNRHILQA